MFRKATGSVCKTELEYQARFEYGCRSRGAEAFSFPPVVAQGSNATTLHYIANTDRVGPQSLVLMDAGAQVHGYCSDITRTFSPHGHVPTPAQRAVFHVVLEAEKACIEACHLSRHPSLQQLHELSVVLLTRGLIDLGLIKNSLHQAFESGEYRKFYPHSIGHYLGIDLHDTSSVSTSERLQPNMCITIEPGIYIPDSEEYPKEFRGIGIRIEDDVVIQGVNDNPLVLSADAIKTLER
eukprot:c18694_g1_i1.p2 GENE.c18694_g1_i1~~c18694_g1_i1.p2  ORF type:complete len:238 (+),score=52.39 c18694_g1_i1:772-1485(+)